MKHYWIGLALGLFAPASLGWDAYRVGVSGRRFGRYSLSVTVLDVSDPAQPTTIEQTQLDGKLATSCS